MEVLLNRLSASTDADFTADERYVDGNYDLSPYNAIRPSCNSHPFMLIEKCFRSFRMRRFVRDRTFLARNEFLHNKEFTHH